MKLSNILQLSLSRDNFKDIDFNENYTLKFLTRDNFFKYYKELEQVISYISVELSSWQDRPSMDDIRLRFTKKSCCLLWIYNDEPIGWAWSNDNVTPDWVNSIRTLPKNTIYGGGAFLSRGIERPPNAGLIFYNLTFKFWLFNLDNEKIYQYSDKWNRVSSLLSYKCGFKKDNFIESNVFKERHLTPSQLNQLITLVDNANKPSDIELQHYVDNVYGVGKHLPHIAINGTKLSPLSINENSKLIEWLVNITGISSNSIHSLHTVDYPEGSKLKPHLDTRSSQTFVFILNQSEQGGDAMIAGKQYSFHAGTILEYNGQKVFHGVTEVTKGERKTLVMFHGHKSTIKSTI